jgi:hypothetical protein
MFFSFDFECLVGWAVFLGVLKPGSGGVEYRVLSWASLGGLKIGFLGTPSKRAYTVCSDEEEGRYSAKSFPHFSPIITTFLEEKKKKKAYDMKLP